MTDKVLIALLVASGVGVYLYTRREPASLVLRTQPVAAGPVPSQPQYPSFVQSLAPGYVPSGGIQPSYPLAPSTTPSIVEPGAVVPPVSSGSRWLDETTYRQELPATRDLMPPFLMHPPECVKPTVASTAQRDAYYACLHAKPNECQTKGGHLTTSEFESLGGGHYAAKYGYCVDSKPPNPPVEVTQALNARCPQPGSRTYPGGVSDLMMPSKVKTETFGRDSGHRHGKYRIWKCAVTGASTPDATPKGKCEPWQKYPVPDPSRGFFPMQPSSRPGYVIEYAKPNWMRYCQKDWRGADDSCPPGYERETKCITTAERGAIPMCQCIPVPHNTVPAGTVCGAWQPHLTKDILREGWQKDGRYLQLKDGKQSYYRYCHRAAAR